jgi:very-short-patch-repair endonuclease
MYTMKNDDKKVVQRTLTARNMRHNPTPAENALWAVLRNHRLAGLKFYRQRVLGPLIADFYCAAARLIIEVDGDIHDYQKEFDDNRTRQLEDHGYCVIRFRNEMVLNNLENVLSQIKASAFGRISDLTPNLQRDCAASSPDTRRGETDLTPNPSPDSTTLPSAGC